MQEEYETKWDDWRGELKQEEQQQNNSALEER